MKKVITMKFTATPTHDGQVFDSDYDITRSLQDIYEQEIWEPGCSPLQVTVDTILTKKKSDGKRERRTTKKHK